MPQEPTRAPTRPEMEAAGRFAHGLPQGPHVQFILIAPLLPLVKGEGRLPDAEFWTDSEITGVTVAIIDSLLEILEKTRKGFSSCHSRSNKSRLA